MNKFEVGKLYALEFICGDGRYPRECLNRTDKTVSFKMIGNEVKRYKIRIDKTTDEEYIWKDGAYINARPTNQFNMCTL